MAIYIPLSTPYPDFKASPGDRRPTVGNYMCGFAGTGRKT